jgi:hypothetical protein
MILIGTAAHRFIDVAASLEIESIIEESIVLAKLVKEEI